MACKSRIVIVGLLVVSGLFAGPVAGADPKPAPRSEPVEYPLSIVALASADRVQARLASLAEEIGMPDGAGRLLSGLMGGDDEMSRFLRLPGLDTTRPIGMMSYPKWFSTVAESESSVIDPSEWSQAPIELIFDSVAQMFVENATLVVCLPAKDRQQLLATVGEMLAKDEEVVGVDDQPGWHQFGKQDDFRLGFVGNYLLIVIDDGETKQFYRNYPEFDKLARQSLGRNGFVYALYRRGLPMLVRDVMAPAFKLAYAAQFQRRDDEPELDFRLRTMFGSTQMELLDLILSHIDEIRITGHVDSATHTIFVEPELVGRKDGKLAKYCNTMKVKSNLFGGLSTGASVVSAWASFPLPAKQWKPVSDALYKQGDAIEAPEIADVIRTAAKTIESGQLEVCTLHPNWEEGLIAVRISGNAQFPELFQKLLVSLPGQIKIDPAIDTVEGVPIHATRWALGDSPTMAMIRSLIGAFLATELPSELPAAKTAVAREVTEVVQQADGKQKIVTRTIHESRPAEETLVWLAATPQAIWIGTGSTENESCPEWFKAPIAESLTKPAAHRSKGSFHVTLRGLGASPKSDIQPVAAEQPMDEGAKEQARGDLLRDLPNAIHCELIPTETGVRLSLRFEEAYFRWFATLSRDSADEVEARRKRQEEKAKASKPSKPSP